MTDTDKVEVVISGIAGVFPESDSVDELKELLFNKQNGITLDSRRWPLGKHGLTSGVGKLKCINQFDNVFFNIHGKLCESTETVIRMNLERSVEAIIDAGINPGDLSNTNTAMFSCTSGSETDSIVVYDESKFGFGILGHNKGMQANRLSYVLNLNGPSFTVFSSFTGGLDALVMAKHMIEKGHIRTAIVGGCNLVQQPNMSLQMTGLGVLTDGTETRSFSEDADGFNRSESSVTIILQNSLDAKRSYGTVMSVKMEQHGGLRGVFTDYSTEYYKQLVMEAYKEAGVDPASVAYVEADGCAIKDVDAMELETIKDVFCTPHRKEPLKIGSVKSNLGHTDASSGLVSIIKAIIAMDTGFIPPNINYTAPNSQSDALTSKKLHVVTEKTPLNGDIVGVNIFGRTGNYGHIVLKKHNKLKKKIYKKGEMFDDGLPRLILVSGRNSASVRKTIKQIENYDVDEEYVSLLHNVFSKNINAHFTRSFFIIPTPEPQREKDVFEITNEKPPVWFVFSGMGSQWLGMGMHLLQIPIFANAIRKCDEVLRTKGLDIVHILSSLDPHLFDNILYSFVGITAVQIGLVDVLRALEIEPDGMLGHSVGELGCAYADGCWTAEQTILAAYARGCASVETPLPDGMMAAIGVGHAAVADWLPADVDVACHNSADSCTVSGPTGSVIAFVESLKADGVFAKAVNVSNISFHSRYIQPAAPALLEHLNKILPEPKLRSRRWLSTSIPESKWNSDLARYCSAEYHTNNLLSPVLFEETSVHIPKNAVVIEIAPHGLLQAILKRSKRGMVHIPLTQRVFGDSIKYLLTAIGKMYCNGLNPNIEMLYDPVSFPVCNGTPPLHTLSLWNHEEEWPLIDLSVLLNANRGERLISRSPSTNGSIEEYKILGRQIFPLSALLFHTWELFIGIKHIRTDTPVIFQDIHFQHQVVVSDDQSEALRICIQSGNGYFEHCLNKKVVLSGYIFASDSLNLTKRDVNLIASKENGNDNPILSLDHGEVYSSFELLDYCVSDVFKTIKRIDFFKDELRADLWWDENWIHYIDAMLQLPALYHMEKRGELVIPVSIQEICINPAVFDGAVPKDFTANYNVFTNEVTCVGVKISLPQFNIPSLKPLVKTRFRFYEQGLVNLDEPGFNTPINFIDMCMKIVFEFKNYDCFEKVVMCPVFESHNQMMRYYAEHIQQTNDSMVEMTDLKCLSSCPDDLQYIALTHDKQLSRVVSLLKKKSRVHLIVSSLSPVPDDVDCTVVMQQRFGDNYLSLVKKNSKVDSDVIIHKLTAENTSYSDQLKNVLGNLRNEIIYVVSKFQPTDGILSLVKRVNEIKNIRFFFILDQSAPSFSTNNPFYSRQLAKDLLVNVYENSKWVTYKEIDFTNSVNIQMSVKKSLLSNLTNTSVKNVSVEYIGLNTSETSIITKYNDVEHELGPFEYSGRTSGGLKVMGIAPFVPTVADVTADPILQWTVPDDMSLEEASTVPVPYAMAYYILTEISKITEEHSVLVHAGLTAVGKAAIDVCLEKKCQVFATVSDFGQMQQIKQRFPTLPHSNVIVYDRENFEIKCLMNNNKMNVILNCLDGEDFYASVRVLADHGKMFQLTKSDMKKKYKLGLESFLKAVSFFSVSADRIIAESEETKKTIKSDIERGLQNGTIKPFDRCVLKGACTGTHALETFEKLTRENEFKRVVIPTSKAKYTTCKDLARQYQCCPDKMYIVVGNATEDWLCLVEWLAQRGALKIVVALRESYFLTPKVSRKFNSVMDRCKGITVQLVSQCLLNTEESASNLLKNTTTAYPLAAVFFTDTNDEKSIENMRLAVHRVAMEKRDENEPFFACLFCGGANQCQSLRSAGLNALCVSWDQNFERPKLMKIVSVLDDLILKSATLTSAVVVYSELVTTSKQQLTKLKIRQSDQNSAYLPSSIAELERISKYVVDEPDFVEVVTKSVLHADAKGAYPIFVVPGFRPNVLQGLYSNLGYPTFEARYPSKFESIYSVASLLVKKLRQITERRAITLIGESWGGCVALVMAQILEADGVLVSLSLLNAVPSTVIEWAADNVNLNNNANSSLLSRYIPIDDKTAQQFSSQQVWDNNLTELIKSKKISPSDDVCAALNKMQTQLNTLNTLRPLSNKLLLVPQVFVSSEFSESDTSILREFCVNQPVVHSTTNVTSQSMLEDANVIKTINENVAFDYPHTQIRPLDVKYNQHYYCSDVSLSC